MSELDANDDLPSVMDEIRTIMKARGVALTSHPEDGGAGSVVYADEVPGIDAMLRDSVSTAGVDWNEAAEPHAHRWLRPGEAAKPQALMLIPVQAIPGQSRLLISVFFDDLTSALKEEAETIYAQRKPFAVGYFRLWQLGRQQARQINAFGTALDRVEMGVLLIDRSREVIFANRAASEMLTEGSALRLHHRMLHASRMHDSLRLQMAVEHVIAANRRSSTVKAGAARAPLLSLERHDASPLMVSVLPAHDVATEPRDVAAIVFVVDPSRNIEDLLQQVCKIYQLSPTESRLTCLLASGRSLVDTAKVMRVKEATARSYLKQIFGKTGTSRQSDLIRVMLSSVVRTNPAILMEVLPSA